ncbi:MAG TPA: ABC-2 family transporter protein [Pseudobdellovibrionaceae bacterium]|nr:ABC-2 family transporter protein [Pseudobdellovibrionaceae bacterium]
MKNLRSFFFRNYATFKLAIASNLEYRFNYFVDAILQPTVSTLIELLLWTAVFRSLATNSLAGFSKEQYLAYALCAPFFARIAMNWMYEFKMINDIETGSINSILMRPTSFFEYYLSQLLGYKMITAFLSFLIPLFICWAFNLPLIFKNLPLALLMVFYYLILIFTLSFTVSTLAFFWNRVHSLTAVKNLSLWFLSGEIIPLDLMPEPWKGILITLPFSSGAFLPVGFLTGRVGLPEMYQGFISISVALLFFGIISAWLWRMGLRKYSGTGA